MLRIIRIFFRLIARVTVYQLSCLFLLLFLYIVFVLFTEPVLESENDLIYIESYNPARPDKPKSNVTETVPVSKYPTMIAYHSLLGSDSNQIECPNNLKCDIYEEGYQLRDDVGGAYLFYASNINFIDLPLPRRPENTFWALMHEESPRNVELFLHETSLALFNFSSTYSRYSDVPFPLFLMGTPEDVTSKEFFVETVQKNSYLNEIAPVLYIQSDCETSTNRDAYVTELIKYLRIDSYGKCLRNKPPLPLETESNYLNNLKDKNYQRFIARYKFHIAIENGVCNDYVTEKFWRPIHLGSVPIYFGSPLIRDWLPNNKSAILIEDFPSPKLLSEHVNRLMANDALYEQYLEHKTKGVISNQRIFEELKSRPYQTDFSASIKAFQCFVCKKLHEFSMKPEKNVVTKKHYDCPIPTSVLSLDVDPDNHWVNYYNLTKNISDHIYKYISQENDSETYKKYLSVFPRWVLRA